MLDKKTRSLLQLMAHCGCKNMAEEMYKPNIVVTYHASSEQQSLLLEVLGGVATLTFITELAPPQREQA
jgi:hypothetical protein